MILQRILMQNNSSQLNSIIVQSYFIPLYFKCVLQPELIINFYQIFKMERKNWTQYQDQILKHLKQDRKIKRWTDIAKLMNTEYKINGRNGKQCRQRYHSHLQRVFPKRPWTRKEQLELLQLHSEIGNKWSRIAQKMIDRSDNNIKNHFYSKLRRAARKVNKFISRIFYKEKKQIKFNDVYLVMEIFEAKFRGNCEWEDYQSDTAQTLKNRLFILALDEDETAEQETEENISLARDIVAFLDEIKKIHKRTRGKPRSSQDNLYSPDLKKFNTDRRSEYQLNVQFQNKVSTITETCGTSQSIETPKTDISTIHMHSNQDFDEMEPISQLILENPQNSDKPCNIESILQSIMSSSSLQSLSEERLFEWNESENPFKSQLENIILMDFNCKQMEDGFQYRSLLD